VSYIIRVQWRMGMGFCGSFHCIRIILHRPSHFYHSFFIQHPLQGTPCGPLLPFYVFTICYVSMAEDQKWKAMDVRVAVSGPSLHPRKVSLFAMLIESLFSDGSFWYILFPFLLLTFPVYKDFFLFRKVSLFFFFIRK